MRAKKLTKSWGVRSWLTQASMAVWFAASLLGCGDPGSGGSGLPRGNATPPPSAPGGIASPVASPSTLGVAIEALEMNTVVIGGIRYLASEIVVVDDSGKVLGFASLALGQTVIIVGVTDGAVRWRLTIVRAP